MDGRHVTLSFIYFQHALEMEKKTIFHILLLNLEHVGQN